MHMAQLMSLSLASVKSTLVFTFLVPAHPRRSTGKMAVKRVCELCRFEELNIMKSLKDNLFRRLIVEHPTLHICTSRNHHSG